MSDDVLSKYMPPKSGKNNEPESDSYTPVPGHAAMLDFELSNGNRVAFPYATLMRAEIDPSVGITLRFAADDVVISGIRLGELYKGIIQHRASSVRVQGEEKPFSDSGNGPRVTKVVWGPAAESTR